MKYFKDGKINIKFENCVLLQEKMAFEQKNMINVYIIHGLDNWPINRGSNVSIKNCSFEEVILTRNAIKRKFICNDYGITFNGSGLWSFGNEFAQNFVIFGVGNRL